MPDILAWVQARFAGEPAPDDCSESDTSVAATIEQLLNAEEPLNIAHAGGDLQSPHSTMFAFSEAAKAGADVLELDVLLSADGELIVQHDLTLDKTTETVGPVADLTLAELDALDNAYWFSTGVLALPRPGRRRVHLSRCAHRCHSPTRGLHAPMIFRSQPCVRYRSNSPTCHSISKSRAKANKPWPSPEALALELADLGRLDSTVVVSFDDAIIDVFHAAAPDVAVSPGTDRLAAWLLTKTPLEDYFRLIQIPPFAQGLEVATAENIARAHDEGLDVWVWPDDAGTQENEDFYIELLLRGADGVLAGRPLAMEAATTAPR